MPPYGSCTGEWIKFAVIFSFPCKSNEVIILILKAVLYCGDSISLRIHFFRVILIVVLFLFVFCFRSWNQHEVGVGPMHSQALQNPRDPRGLNQPVAHSATPADASRWRYQDICCEEMAGALITSLKLG